jgi:Cupin-like domain
MRVVCQSIPVSMGCHGDRFVATVEATLNSYLARIDLTITSDYYTAFRRSRTRSYKVTASEYLTTVDSRWEDASLLCPEMPLPGHLATEVQLITPPGFAWSKRAVAMVHAGRAHCMSPVHFDWDHTWVAHACLTGRKRFFLFPPKAGWLLHPVINTSAFAIPRFSEIDRRDLLSKLGGLEIVLEAGQGILFPSIFWHGVLYDEPSLGVSVRFEASAGGRPFAVLPRSWLLQRLVWRFFEQGYGREAFDFLSEYLRSFFIRTKTWKERYRRITSLCRQALLARGEEQGAFEYVAENFSSELGLASEELKVHYENIDDTHPRERDRLREVREYIFDGVDRRSAARELLLSKYALSVRQGLPPKRGLVQIEQEISI